MTELEFAQRLKQYRKAKGLTQQELADMLGVSNKSVSRWESGSYPDVATLGPLARALGVTIDELLGESPSIRSLEKSDWQNWLSLAFSVGGGVLFFLLILFTPLLVAYLLYLGALVYGVYLQKHYTRPNRWFFRATTLMNFFVNCAFLWRLFQPFTTVSLAFVSSLIVSFFNGTLTPEAGTTYLVRYLLLSIVYLLVAAGLTALTMFLIQKYSGLRYEWGIPAIKLERVHMDWRKWVPVGLMALVTVFWSLYLIDGPRILPAVFYLLQDECYGVLMLFCAVVCFVTFNWKGHRGMLLPSLLLMAVSALLLPNLLTNYAPYNDVYQTFYSDSDYLYHFGQPGIALYIVIILLTLLYLLCSHIRLKWSNITSV